MSQTLSFYQLKSIKIVNFTSVHTRVNKIEAMYEIHKSSTLLSFAFMSGLLYIVSILFLPGVMKTGLANIL